MRVQGAAWETEQTSAPHMDSGQSANLQMKMTQLDVCILACNHQLPRSFSKKGVDSSLYANKYLAFKIKWFQLATSLDCRAQPWQTGFASVGQNICKGAAKDLPPSKWCLGVARLPCTLLSFTQRRGGGRRLNGCATARVSAKTLSRT